MPTSRSPMEPGSTAFTVCVSVASVSAFIALLAIILILTWLWLRQASPSEREELEREIAYLQRQLSDSQSQAEQRNSSSQHHVGGRVPRDEELRRVKKELSSKDGELSKAWESIVNLEKKLESQSRDLDHERKQRQAISRQNDQLHNERQRATEESQRTKHMRPQTEGLKARFDKKRVPEKKEIDFGMQNEDEEYQLQRTDRGMRIQEEEFANMSREWEMKLDDERKRYQDLLARNQYLQDELKAVRRYGSMEDQYSGAEVVEKVEKLNSDILQVAATVAEELDVDQWANNRLSVDNTNSPDAEGLAKVIGRNLTTLLRTSQSQDLNIVLQTAFQASMAYQTRLITSSWSYGFSQQDQLFNEAYRNMRKEELQAVSGRWRQLAMTHLNASRSANEQHLVPRLTEVLADIVVAAGYRQDATIVRKQIADRFAHRLEEVIKAAQDLRRVMGEEITSCDLEFIWLGPGTPYDPGLMEDIFGLTSTNDRAEVECVTDVGLRSTEKISGSTKCKHSVLLKAKVLLPSALAGIHTT